MKKKNISFKDIYKIYQFEDEKERKDWVWANAPLHDVILDMVVKHLPNPVEAQHYRIPKIWSGEKESTLGNDLVTCNKNGKVAFVVTRIIIDPRVGKEVYAGRLFSGTIHNGMEVYSTLTKQKTRIQQVLVYEGIKPRQVDNVPAGNVIALVGLNTDVGDTISTEDIQPFEAIKHIFQPVITKSIEVVRSSDLPKLIDILRKVSKEDPSIKIEINEETGENLMSGMGELHLEIIEGRIKNEKGLEVKLGPPIVVYRETVTKASPEIESRTPNGHNILFFSIEPLEDQVFEAIQNNQLPEVRFKKKAEDVWKKLESLGVDGDEARQYREIYKGNVFLDKTRGIVLLGEILESIMDGWKLVIDGGPLAREQLTKTKVTLHDIKIHVDHMHRGPAQVYPAVRLGMHDAMKQAGAGLLEPIQTHMIEAPLDFMGTVTNLVASKRGVLVDVQQEAGQVVVKAHIPVAEMIGWSNDLRSATEGRGISSLVDQHFRALPRELQTQVIYKIRARKGLSENQ
jgi:elongation factor 2